MSDQSGKFDLEGRTFLFAKNVRAFIRQLPKGLVPLKDVDQLISSSGSVGANYIEANESFSSKDFFYRIKICRKEAKEACYWLQLLYLADGQLENTRADLTREATELMNIFGAICRKSK